MKKQSIVIATAALLALVFAAGAYYYDVQKQQETSRLAAAADSVFRRPNSPSLGPESAPVQIVEFFDPACESCRMMYPHVKAMMKANPGKVRLTLRYATFHTGSDYVAAVLEAARMQGSYRYWQAVETILEAQPVWADHSRPRPQLVWDYLANTGLDIAKAQQDMNSPAIAALLKQDAADLATLNVNKTPSFFINGKPLVKFGPDGLNAQVQEAINATSKN